MRECATGFTVLDHGIVNETALEYTPPGGSSFWLLLEDVVDEMRQKGKCDHVFILGHGGIVLDRKISERFAGRVDAVLGGHTHDMFFENEYSGPKRVVMHAGSLLRQAGVLEMAFGTDGAVISARGSMRETASPQHQPPSEPPILVTGWTHGAKHMPMSSHDCRCGKCPIGDIATELMLYYLHIFPTALDGLYQWWAHCSRLVPSVAYLVILRR